MTWFGEFDVSMDLPVSLTIPQVEAGLAYAVESLMAGIGFPGCISSVQVVSMQPDVNLVAPTNTEFQLVGLAATVALPDAVTEPQAEQLGASGLAVYLHGLYKVGNVSCALVNSAATGIPNPTTPCPFITLGSMMAATSATANFSGST